MKKYIRSERANLFEPNVYISMVVKIIGTIATEEVRHAVESAYEANEATMSKIVLGNNGDAWYEKMESSGCKFYSDNREWQGLLNESEKNPFALEEGELIRTYLTKENQERVLLIHAHHLAGDGKSVLILIKDIVSSLAGKTLTYKPMNLVDQKYLTQRADLRPYISLLVKKTNRKWEKTGKSFTWDDYCMVHNHYWSEHSSEIEVKTYNVNEVKKKCRKDVTLNSYLIAELLREYPECKVVGIPVSIREDDNGMSNQTSGIAIKYQYKKKASFEENLIKVHKEIYKKIKNKNMKYFILFYMEQLCPSLIDAVLLQTHGCYQNKQAEKMARIMGYIGNGGRDLGVTNLNQIDIQNQDGNFRIEDILFIPPKVSYTKRVIGISTYGDRLTVCYHNMRKKTVS